MVATGTWLLLAVPAGFALFVWWFATGALVFLDGLPARSFRWTMASATVLLGAGLWGLHAEADATGVADAFCSFACGMLIWIWQETAFLVGRMTGPRKTGCAPGASLATRAQQGLAALLYHEIALLAGAIVVVWLTDGAANRVGTWAYLILWVMRASAKLNLLFGVRNLSEEFLPAHLRFLVTFMARRSMNPLLPVSIVAGTAAAATLLRRAVATADPFTATGNTLMAMLLALAVLEHLLMVVPIPPTLLWGWGLRSHIDRSSRVAMPGQP